jgi:hypothetical protein
MNKSWAWWNTPVISLTAGNLNRKITVHAVLSKKHDPISKIASAKRVEGLTQLVEYLPHKLEALSSNPALQK